MSTLVQDIIDEVEHEMPFVYSAPAYKIEVANRICNIHIQLLKERKRKERMQKDQKEQEQKEQKEQKDKENDMSEIDIVFQLGLMMGSSSCDINKEDIIFNFDKQVKNKYSLKILENIIEELFDV